LNGETDYTKISSNQGPCFYPAGHLWHYMPLAWLHYQTPYAEFYIKFGHIVLHSITNLFVGKIAFLYLDSLKDAQLLVLALLSSPSIRLYYTQMFND
jgi:hypothetical protein